MAFQSILRGFASPLLQIGDLAFDAELSVDRGGERQYTRNRVGAGALLTDHSFSEPREFSIEGAVAGLGQPQNIGRPGASNGLAVLRDIGLDALEGLTGRDFSTRVADFEQRMQAIIDRGDMLEVISKVVGRVPCVMLSWRASTRGEDGDRATFMVRLLEVLTAGFTISGGTELALALNGSGGVVAPGGGGQSSTTPVMVDLVP